MNYPITTCTAGEYDVLKKHSPMLVDKLGDHLIVVKWEDQYLPRSMPLLFIFVGTEKQKQYWLRDKDIDPRDIVLITDMHRLQGRRGRPFPVQLDPYWAPMGPDEREATNRSNWYIQDMESKTGSLWDVVRFLHPEDEKKWIRLA